MAYRRSYRKASPAPRTIVVKYAGKCACCGATIKAGETATYYPVGTIAGCTQGVIGHIGGLEGTTALCTENLRMKAVNDYAGDGLDERYEDDCARACGLL